MLKKSVTSTIYYYEYKLSTGSVDNLPVAVDKHQNYYVSSSTFAICTTDRQVV